MRVHANVLDGKRPPIIEKRLLLVPYGRNQRREGFLQVSFIESGLAGAQRPRDNKQCWLVLAQCAIPSCSVVQRTFFGAGLKVCTQFLNGVSLSVRRDSYRGFQIAIVFVVRPIWRLCGD